jgi:hypothetical protein
VTRVLALLLALAAWFCAGFTTLAALFWGLTLKCDDHCSSIGGWRHDPDAWQWNAMAALGVLAFVAGGVVFVSVWRRRPVFGAIGVVIGLAAVYVLAGLFSSDWMDHLGRQSGGELLLITTGVFAPIVAVLLTWTRPSGATEVRHPDRGR